MKAPPTFNTLLNKLLAQFARLVKLKAGNWLDQALVQEFNESREWDPSGLTTALMIRAQLDIHAAETTFSVQDMLTNPTEFNTKVDAIRGVYAALEHPLFATAVAEHLAAVRRSVGDSEDTHAEEWLANVGYIGYVRRDAYRALATLQVHQFTQGDPSGEPLAVNGTLFEFWNINSLLRILQQQVLTGVSLCLIRDPQEVMASYFVFAVKNGDTMTILTDREEVPHPLYWKMTRRPERQLDQRAARLRFPYHLLDLTRDTKGDLRKVNRQGLVRQQEKLIPLAKLCELPIDEYLWVKMTLELLAGEYGKNNRHTPALSYTGEMVVSPEALVGAGASLLLKGYQPLALVPPTMATTTAQSTAVQWERPATGIHEWMITEYGPRVPDAVLAVVGDAAARQLESEHKKVLHTPNTRAWPGDAPAAVLEALQPTHFGTAEELARDYVWTARVNQCKAINAIAHAEYTRTHAAVTKWCQRRLESRREALLDAAVRGEFVTAVRRLAKDRKDWLGFDDHFEYGRSNVVVQRAFRTPKDFTERGASFRVHWDQPLRLGQFGTKVWPIGAVCAIDGTTRATIVTRFQITCPQALADVLGCTVEELPLPLQHWLHRDLEPYDGNSILGRLDPSDWAITNPWNGLDLDVLVATSQRGHQRRRKALGLPAEYEMQGDGPFRTRWRIRLG